jgi:hydroxymethylbilane synthase
MVSNTHILPPKLVIATRASRLALWQAEHVRDCLIRLYPSVEVELLKLSTRGDEILDRSLQKIGGKGLFIKELEYALLDGRADLAVHSLKDVPVDLTEPFELAAILPRAEVRDAWVSNHYAEMQALPHGAVVGTSSLRRESQLRRLVPHVTVKPLRGNLDTRLGKLDAGEFDAIILAAVGLQRLGLADRIRGLLSPQDSLPAAGQGSLGIEIRADRADLKQLLQPLVCLQTTACSLAERAVSRVLGGSCTVPIAAYATIEGNQIHLKGLVATPDGQRVISHQASAPVDDALKLGEAVAHALQKQGADQILASLSQTGHAE